MSVAVGNINADPFPDIAALGNDGSVYVLLGNGDGSFGVSPMPTLTFTSYPSSLLLVDVDGNGSLDLLTVGNYSVAVALGNGDGTFQAPLLSTLGPSYLNGPTTIATGYLDSNSTLDVVVSSMYSYSSPILLMKATVTEPSGRLSACRPGWVATFS